jgi:predicted metal-binding membrane protein
VDAPATAAPAPPLAPVFLRDRVLLLAALGAAVALSWAYLAWMAADMAVASGASLAHCAAMPGMTSSSGAYLAWTFVMWAVMAVAMMLPTALPLVLLFDRFRRARHPGRGAAAAIAALVAGYLAAWFAFAIVGGLLQYGLEHAGAVTPVMGRLRSAAAGGVVLVAVGAFQLSPLKEACLARCRSPLMFLMTRWRGGRLGAFAMGLDHGLFCVGCCWALMLAMFVAGVMNLAWMAALGVLMAAEKVVPRGDLLARAAGVALAGAGAWLLLA